LDANTRIDWLLLQPAPAAPAAPAPVAPVPDQPPAAVTKPLPRPPYIEPQPWLQLATYLDSTGDHAGAKHVRYKLKCRLAERRGQPAEGKGWLAKLNACFADPKRQLALLKGWLAERGLKLFAYLEEKPLRIGWSIGGFLLAGTLLFAHAEANRAMAPTDKDAYGKFQSHGLPDAAYPKFNPVMYTLDNSLPLVHLGQDDKWGPDPHPHGGDFTTSYEFLMAARWFLILAGWFQATILAAALSGPFKGDD
jgi:hypothetical protein